jgi:hypothetical protein
MRPVPFDQPPANVPMVFEPGVWAQIYTDAIQHTDEIDVWFAKYKAIGCLGVIIHVFPGQEARVDPFVQKARAHGLLVGGSEGLDTTSRTGAQKGQAMGQLARDHRLDAVGFDAESHWDSGDPAVEKETADMAAAFATFVAPTNPIRTFDQAWPQTDAHKGFPYRAMGQIVKARADQRYLKPWTKYLGTTRYENRWPLWEGDWQSLERGILADTLRQRLVTIEQYGYADIPADGCEIVVRHPTVIAWGEPWADASFVLMLQVRQFLVVRGFIDPAWSNANDAILRFQQDYNKTAATKISEDGRAGMSETIPAMGLKLEPLP